MTDVDRYEDKYDDGGYSVALRASDVDVVTVEVAQEAFSVNWTARTNGRDFVEVCKSLARFDEASAIIYSLTERHHLHVAAKELFWALPVEDLGFIRLNLPELSVAWQETKPPNLPAEDVGAPDTVGCAMQEVDFPFITGLFENTASEGLIPLTKELESHLGFLRVNFKEHTS